MDSDVQSHRRLLCVDIRTMHTAESAQMDHLRKSEASIRDLRVPAQRR